MGPLSVTSVFCFLRIDNRPGVRSPRFCLLGEGRSKGAEGEDVRAVGRVGPRGCGGQTYPGRSRRRTAGGGKVLNSYNASYF